MSIIKLLATCLTTEQARVCAEMGIEVFKNYVRSYGEISPDCVTDFSVHCFNSATLAALKKLGVRRATLHPELNLAQIRDLEKSIDTEAIIYGKLPLMKMKNPPVSGELKDRTNTVFAVRGGEIYNSVPIFVADKLAEIEKSGISHGRLVFTTEKAADVRAVISAYLHRTELKINFTRGKFFSKTS